MESAWFYVRLLKDKDKIIQYKEVLKKWKITIKIHLRNLEGKYKIL